ncbi:hypothetical protein BCR33DRAFT_745284 [Rhizoclosmatium globosum]|uniref:Uncharacterized protein n=1 Tax=Rhizoclosmatium globosum TaxID=329046 RepID=A0A1Y2B5R4_9FUNG|nr:hypothetical protein BCR33DRAFT_745284 [Rhizoclosmatium globosum]|eukprot:ORY29445.1 hypothetical protein BCR33DRAFT_745284 [Rhizoclosmatium globosum]
MKVNFELLNTNFNGYRLNFAYKTKHLALTPSSHPHSCPPKSTETTLSLTEHKRNMAHVNLNNLSKDGLLYIDSTGTLNQIQVANETIAVSPIAHFSVSDTLNRSCPSVQVVNGFAVFCDGGVQVSVLDLEHKQVIASATLSFDGKSEFGAEFQGCVIVGFLQRTRTRFWLRFNKWRSKITRIRVAFLAQCVGSSVPTFVHLDSNALLVGFTDGVRPFQQTFPVVKPVFGPPVPPSFSKALPSEQQDPFDPLQATTSLQPKPTALNILDDAMDEGDDGQEYTILMEPVFCLFH